MAIIVFLPQSNPCMLSIISVSSKWRLQGEGRNQADYGRRLSKGIFVCTLHYRNIYFPYYRARLLIAVKPWRKTWSKHEEERYDKKKLKELEQDLKLKAKQEKDERNRKIVERRRIKEENRKKSEIVQKVSHCLHLNASFVGFQE